MSDDALSKLLQTSVDQYDRAARWSSVLLGVLAVFHMTTFERFVDITRDAARSQEQLRQLAAHAATTKKASDDIKHGFTRAKEAATQRVGSEFEELRRRFALLNLDVAEVWCHAHATPQMSYASCVAPALERAGLGQPQMQPQMQAQMPMGAQMQTPMRPSGAAPPPSNMPMGARTSDRELPSGGAPALRILPSDLAERIAALPQRGDALIDLLEPLIDAELVRPVFERLNRFWRDEQLPALAALADSGLQALDRIAGADDQAASAANRSIEATRRLKQAAASVAFSPPAQPRWWLTTAGKGEASAQLATLVDSVADRGQRAAVASLETVLTGLTQAESAKAGALKSLEQAMERLKAGFEAQRAQLGSLVEPLKSVAIDLEFFCRHFALIVALAGAAAIIWPGEKLRIVRLTARMAEEAGQDISIWRWFEARRRGLLRGRAGPFLLGGGLIAWSLYAAYRLSGLEGAGPALWREAAAGLAILLGAMAWSRYADRPA